MKCLSGEVSEWEMETAILCEENNKSICWSLSYFLYKAFNLGTNPVWLSTFMCLPSSDEVQLKLLHIWSVVTWTLSILTLFFLCSVLFEDQDSYLCNVTLFRKAVDDFKHKAREYK